jgi:hypothetical protein
LNESAQPFLEKSMSSFERIRVFAGLSAFGSVLANATDWIKRAVVVLIGLVAACNPALGAGLVDVQIYENTRVFPGESRFFMTARDTDKTFLAANPQMGWVKLDTFAAYAVEPGSTSLANVCRFFLPTLATHFFTAESAECERFKADPAFIFEGLDFAVARPAAGACAAGLASLTRFYNDGAKRNVSGNHFYGTGTSVGVGNYLARFSGWRNEGVGMCVPAQEKAAAQAIVAGRGVALEASGVPIATPGSSIVQVLNIETLQSKSYADVLGGDADWLVRTAFDELRGKLYLVRAATTIMARSPDNFQAPPYPFLAVRPTRTTNNVLEIDIASGAMRYLALGGTFTDVHFNAEQRLLMLVNVETNETVALTWFDPSQNSTVSSASLAGVAHDASLQYVGKPACEYLLKRTTVLALPTIITLDMFSPTTFTCIDAAGRARSLPPEVTSGMKRYSRRGDCVIGDSLIAGERRLNLTDLTLLSDLPRVSFGAVTTPSNDDSRAVDCFVRGAALYVVYFAKYSDVARGYFTVEYRDSAAVGSVGPLTEWVNASPNLTTAIFFGTQPSFVGSPDASFVKRNAGSTTELWALTPQYAAIGAPVATPRRDLLQRFDATTFQPIGNIDIVVPSQTLHVSTR